MTDTSAKTPDRNEFLRRLEANERDGDEAAEDETTRFLQEAGLGSTPIDPASLEALRALVTPKRDSSTLGRSLNVDTLAKSDSKVRVGQGALVDGEDPKAGAEPSEAHQSTAPVSVVRTTRMSRVGSDLTQAAHSRMTTTDDAATDASIAGSVRARSRAPITEATPTETRILEQLEMQTSLLLDMQRRLDELDEIVAARGRSAMMTTMARDQELMAAATVGPPRRHMDGAAAPIPPRPHRPQHQREIPDDAPLPHMRLFAFFLSLPAIIRSTRIAQICRVFWTLHRRQVGRIDAGFWVKLVVMIMLIMAKLNSGKNRRKQRNSTVKTFQFYVAGLVLTIGFMVQSGYARFIYNFFVEERYHERIWNGEDIDVDNIPPRRDAAAAANRNVDDGRDRNHEHEGAPPQAQPPRGLLQGGIPAARGANGNVGIGDAVADVIYLLLSFVLSIFPMWKPEGPPRVHMHQPPAGAEAEDQAQPRDEPELVDEPDPVEDGDEDDDEIYREE